MTEDLKKKNISVTLPAHMVRHLTESAIDIGITRSQLIEDLLVLAMRTIDTDLYIKVLETYRSKDNEN